MPRSQTRVKYPPIDAEAVSKAVCAVLSSESTDSQVSICQTAKNFNISKTVLLRQLKIHRKNITDRVETDVKYYDRRKVKQVFSNEEELKLVSYLNIGTNLHCGLGKQQLQTLAYQFA